MNWNRYVYKLMCLLGEDVQKSQALFSAISTGGKYSIVA